MFHPHTKTDREEMLKTVGFQSLAELFSAVPKEFRFPELNLPPRNSEMEVMSLLHDLAEGKET